MRKLVVYPFDINLMPLGRYSDMLTDYDSVIPVIEDDNFVESTNRDISYLDGGSQCQVSASSNFEIAIKQAHSVFFANDVCDKEKLLRYLLMSESLGKKIYISSEVCSFIGISSEKHTVLSYSEFNTEVKCDSKLLNFSVPIVFVMGQGQRCNKFDIQLGVRKKFVKLGYKVSQVGTKEYSSLFGFHALPRFSNVPLWQKILLYNRYFRQVVAMEQPDVLIVGAPGGTMPIDERFHELFGESAISIATSLKPDLVIHSLYLSKPNKELLNEYKNHAKYALGVNIDFFHMSNSWLVFEHDKRTRSFLMTDFNKVLESEGEAIEEMFNVFIEKTTNRVYTDIVLQLQENIERI